MLVYKQRKGNFGENDKTVEYSIQITEKHEFLSRKWRVPWKK